MSKIQQFYSGKNILITGGTGFLGLALIEKLLRSFPDVGDIYMIVRSKNNEDLEVRKEKFINHQVFNRLKSENTVSNLKTLFSKLKWIQGELGQSNLGIPTNILHELLPIINVIIHSAAAINFNFPLKSYIDMNLKSTRDLLEFANGCRDFQCFLYMSTAYSQVQKSQHYVSEDILKHPTNPRELLKMADSITNDEMEQVAPQLVQDWVTYYAYCKNAAENLCLEYEKQFGIVVYRPGIVVHSVAEPAPYWIGNKLGFPRALMEANRGLVLFSDPDVNANSVPVDYTINGALAAVFQTSIDRCLKVFNFTANNNPISFSTAFQYYSNSIPGYEHKLVPKRYELLGMKSIPAGSKEEKLVKEMSSYYYFQKMVEYFMWNTLHYENNNIEALWSQMWPQEQKLLPFDVKSINWRQFYSEMNANEFGMPKITFDV